jgi:hypothetical protein
MLLVSAATDLHLYDLRSPLLPCMRVCAKSTSDRKSHLLWAARRVMTENSNVASAHDLRRPGVTGSVALSGCVNDMWLSATHCVFGLDPHAVEVVSLL